MALTFSDRRWHDETTGTVTFPAWNGQIRVSCRITDEALKAVFGSGAGAEKLIETFDTCRPSIEEVAVKKFDLAGEPMKLVLTIGDFETRAPVKEEPKTHSADEIAAMVRHFRANHNEPAIKKDPTLFYKGKGNLGDVMAALKAQPLGSQAKKPDAAPGDAASNETPAEAAPKAADKT